MIAISLVLMKSSYSNDFNHTIALAFFKKFFSSAFQFLTLGKNVEISFFSLSSFFFLLSSFFFFFT